MERRSQMATEQTTEHSELEVVSLLVQAADADTVYRDLYLERASLHLVRVFPEAEYRQLGAGQARIDALMQQMQAVMRREDWAKVSELSAQADALRRTMQAKAATMKLAASVYDAPPVAADPFSPGLTALSLVKGATPAALRESLIAVFDQLAKADPECSELYSERRSRFARLVVASGLAKAEKSGKEGTDLDELRHRAREAAECGNFVQLQSLADEIVRTSAARAERSPAKAEQPTATAGIGRHAVSIEPFPSECLDRALQLGLEHLCIKARFAEVPDALHEFATQYLWRPDAPTDELASEGAFRLRARLDEVGVPKDRVTPFVEVAALFGTRPFINSGGCRYFPTDPGEYVLIETFPEDQEPPRESELLKSLGLSRRRALSRVEIEQALRRCGSSVLQGRLALDPRVFRIVCVPYHVYNCVGEERGWGQQRLWTHVDGYGVRGGRLGALVAGDVRFGGLFDLTMLDPADQRQGVVARFCVVRRSRLQTGS